MLRCQAIIDGGDQTGGVVGQRAADRIVPLDAPEDPTTAVEVDQYGQGTWPTARGRIDAHAQFASGTGQQAILDRDHALRPARFRQHAKH